MRWGITRGLEAVLRVVARVLMLAVFVLGWSVVTSVASFLSGLRMPPADNLVGVAMAVMVAEVALWCWWTANTLAHLQRRAVAAGGIDRNPRRTFEADDRFWRCRNRRRTRRVRPCRRPPRRRVQDGSCPRPAVPRRGDRQRHSRIWLHSEHPPREPRGITSRIDAPKVNTMATLRRSAAVLATFVAVSACAPSTAADQPTAPAVAGSAADEAGRSGTSSEVDTEAAASEAAASEAAASEAAASEAAASEAAASEAAAAEAEAEAKAEAEAEAKAEAEAEAKAEAEARAKAEEEARKKAEEEAKEAAEVQTVLFDLGYYGGKIDGDVGPLTLAAIKDFQRVNDLEVDGKVGPRTKEALASDDAKPKPPPEPEETEDASEADDAPDSDLPSGTLSVSDAKQALKDLGYYIGSVDGDNNDALRSALQAFQLVNGITADGVLGPQSSDALRNPSSPSLVGGPGTRIEIDLTHQVMHLVKDGSRVRTMPTSSGSGEQYLQADGDTANAKTPVGTFTIQRRIAGERVADLGTLYDPMYFYKGWAIHGSNSVPPYPASHGCTRLTRPDALWLWDQVPDGTTVVIHGGEHTFIPTG